MKPEYMEYFDSTNGYFQSALGLMNPKNDDYSIYSGCVLFTIGFEKFLKGILEEMNPLMVLEKVEFEDIKNMTEGNKIGNRKTISLLESFQRLKKIYPILKSQDSHVKKINDGRNFLVHGSGLVRLGSFERKVRSNITTTIETICNDCIKKTPIEIIGEGIWLEMIKYRDAYIEAKSLEINERIDFLKRRFFKGEDLTFEDIIFEDDSTIDTYICPVCEAEGEIEIAFDVDVEGGPDGPECYGFVYAKSFKCWNCGFNISDPDELDFLITNEERIRLFEPDPYDYYDCH